MSVYCLCEASNDKPDSQHFMAPNRYCAVAEDSKETFPPLALKTPMTCIKTGASQVILYEYRPNDWSGGARPSQYRKHHPNVDVFECPNCHARIVRE